MSYLFCVATLLFGASGVILAAYFLYTVYLVVAAMPTMSGWQQTGWQLTDFKALTEDVIDLAQRARRYLYVVCRGTKYLWANPQVQKALRRASTGPRKVNVEFVVGEGFDGTEDHPLVQLANEGVITLHRLSHELERHFAIADGKHYTLEWPSDPGAKIRYYNAIRNNPVGGNEVIAEFHHLAAARLGGAPFGHRH